MEKEREHYVTAIAEVINALVKVALSTHTFWKFY